MFLFHEGAAAYRFRNLLVMPFSFMARALVPALPFLGLSTGVCAIALLYNPLIPFAFNQTPGSILSLGVIVVFILCQAAMFCLVLRAAAKRIFPEGRSEVVVRETSFAALVVQMLPAFCCVVGVFLFFGCFFSLLAVLPFKKAILALPDLVAGRTSFSMWFMLNIGLHMMSPSVLVAGVLSVFYFRFVAREAIRVFEQMLELMQLRQPGAPALAAVYSSNRRLLASLVSVPHLAFAVLAAVWLGSTSHVGLGSLIQAAGHPAGSLAVVLGQCLDVHLVFTLISAWVAGTVAVTWMAAAQTDGALDPATIQAPRTMLQAQQAARSFGRRQGLR